MKSKHSVTIIDDPDTSLESNIVKSSQLVDGQYATIVEGIFENYIIKKLYNKIFRQSQLSGEWIETQQVFNCEILDEIK